MDNIDCEEQSVNNNHSNKENVGYSDKAEDDDNDISDISNNGHNSRDYLHRNRVRSNSPNLLSRDRSRSRLKQHRINDEEYIEPKHEPKYDRAMNSNSSQFDEAKMNEDGSNNSSRGSGYGLFSVKDENIQNLIQTNFKITTNFEINNGNDVVKKIKDEDGDSLMNTNNNLKVKGDYNETETVDIKPQIIAVPPTKYKQEEDCDDSSDDDSDINQSPFSPSPFDDEMITM
eukprot:313065_1